jgi:hypothetical protein
MVVVLFCLVFVLYVDWGGEAGGGKKWGDSGEWRAAEAERAAGRARQAQGGNGAGSPPTVGEENATTPTKPVHKKEGNTHLDVVDPQPLQHRGREHARRKRAPEDGLELGVQPADAQGLEVELALLEQGRGGDALLPCHADGAGVGVGEDEGRGAAGHDGGARHLPVLRLLPLLRLLPRARPSRPIALAAPRVGRERPHRQPQVEPLQLEHHLLPARQHLARQILKQARRQLACCHLARLAVGRVGDRGDLGVDDGGDRQRLGGGVGDDGHGVAGGDAQDAALDRVEGDGARGDGRVRADVEDAVVFCFCFCFCCIVWCCWLWCCQRVGLRDRERSASVGAERARQRRRPSAAARSLVRARPFVGARARRPEQE